MTLRRFLAVSTMLAALSPLPAMAQTADTDDTATATDAAAPVKAKHKKTDSGVYVTKEELPKLVEQALMDKPEIITNAIQHMRQKQEAEATQKSKLAIASHKDELFNDPESPSVGSASADVTIVEFFDYHCGYCKHLLPAITQLIQEDKKVRVVFKEFPILSEDSKTAAEAALAVNHIAKDKYFEFHTALMKFNGKFDEASLAETAKSVGIDGAALKAEMAKPEIAAEIEKDHRLGETLGVRGTPAVIIGGTLLPGAVSYEDLKKMVGEVRAGKDVAMPQAGQ